MIKVASRVHGGKMFAMQVRLQLVWIGVGLLVGCAKSHDVSHSIDRDGGDPDVPSIQVGPLCTRLAEIDCEAEQQCCGKVSRSRQSCQNELAQSCAQSLFLDQLAEDGSTAFNAEAAERAFGELEERASRCDVSVLRWLPSAEGLRALFDGTRGAGESCKPVGGVTGSTESVAAALSACSHAEGLACLPQGLLGEWTCAAKQPTGEPCITDDNCADGGACDNFEQPALGVCVERLPLGAACEFDGECESLVCDDVCREPDVDTVYCLEP